MLPTGRKLDSGRIGGYTKTKGLTNQDIIKTAFQVWGRTLYLTTSLSDVAAKLGVSKPALYRHFRSKKELLDSMYAYFFDDYAASLRKDYERAASAPEALESLLLMCRTLTAYYARHRDFLVFSITQVYGSQEAGNLAAQLLDRGIDIQVFNRLKTPGSGYPTLVHLLMFSLIIWIVHFFKSFQASGQDSCLLPEGEVLPEEAIGELVKSAEQIVTEGLNFDRGRIDALDYGALEEIVSRQDPSSIDDGGLLRAVAEAVAEAGPWDASMRRVAALSGLSKSTLYAHFENKKDMIRQLFLTEFGRLLKFAEAGARASRVMEEQVYMAIFSVANYLRARPAILIAADWIRSRKLDLGMVDPPRVSRIFRGVDMTIQGVKVDFESPAIDRYTHWVFFLIVNTLMRRPPGMDFGDLPDTSIRTLFRFIALGLKGFLK